jgi:DNA-binding LacI/PurR family transcriptional regulator
MASSATDSPSIRAVAKAAGVSTGTVSRALKNLPGLSEDTRAHVVAVATELGYDTGKLRTRRLRRVTLLLSRMHRAQFHNPFYSLILHGVEEACRAAGLALSYTSIGSGDSLTEVLWNRHDPDGIICAGFLEDDLLKRLHHRGRPMVLVDYRWTGVESVNPDNETGAFLATEHLIEAGYQRIAYLYGSLAHYSIHMRMRGYRAALYKHGRLADPTLEEGMNLPGDYAEEAQEAMRRLLASPHPPDAVFACSDVAATSAMAVIKEAGLSVPGDIGVVGFDDLPSSASHTPSLSTIHVDTSGLGAQAVERLLAVNQGAPSQQPLLPVTLHVRDSSRR